MKVTCDQETQRWLNKNLAQQTTVVQCEKCGLFFKPSLGHKCRKEEKGMTNYEKNKELLDMYAVACLTWGVSRDGNISNCSSYYDRDCADCIFYRKGDCSEDRLEWLQQEYKEPEPEVDWSKVPIDTPILVKTGINDEWTERIFAGYIAGKVCVFDGYDTSENFVGISPWNYAKLAEQENKV